MLIFANDSIYVPFLWHFLNDSEHDQEIPQSHTEDQPMPAWEKDTAH